MASADQRSKAKAILLAVHFASQSDFAPLQQLVSSRPQLLTVKLTLRILLSFVPESTDSAQYVPLVQALADGISASNTPTEIDDAAVRNLAEAEARQRVKSLPLTSLDVPKGFEDTEVDLVTSFLVRRARAIDAQTGLLQHASRLVEPFLDGSETLRTWYISTLLPLERLHQRTENIQQEQCSLKEFEALEGRSGLEALVGMILGPQDASEDPVWLAQGVRTIIGPWLYSAYNQPQSQTAERSRSWPDFFDWFLASVGYRFGLCVDLVEHWKGPADVDFGGVEHTNGYLSSDLQQELEQRYAQFALAAIYLAPDGTLETLQGCYRILSQVARLLDLEELGVLSTESNFLAGFRPVSSQGIRYDPNIMLPNFLVQQGNELTVPSAESVSFASGVVVSAAVLAHLGSSLSPCKVAEIQLSRQSELQGAELSRLIQSLQMVAKSRAQRWDNVQDQIRWLHHWGRGTGKGVVAKGVFGEVPRDKMEKELLGLLLLQEQQTMVTSNYVDGDIEDLPLPLADVESVVLDCAMTFFDKATNCNRHRGSLKKASDIVTTFYPSIFPSSGGLERAQHLLKATHALSFYALTLQHGVPFEPVSIRKIPDPVSLISKVLEQNSQSYTQLDDLIGIGRSLVDAGLVERQDDGVQDDADARMDRTKFLVDKRIIGMAIEVALTEEDFETAYSFVMNRLGSRDSASDSDKPDDISWRAAFQAGKYRSGKATRASTHNANPEIRRVEMRMELLSQALMLAPPAALAEVLGVWRRCEEELNLLVVQETQEEESWDEEGDHRIPGDFQASPAAKRKMHQSRGPTGDEAPMGLFDVARGAASAFSRSSFVNRADHANLQPTTASRAVEGTLDSPRSSAERVRKRDMVSNMVTGGLASGIGWVIGATPIQNEQA